MSRAFTDNNNSFNTIFSNNFNFTAADDEPKILAWLSPLEPQVRHQDIRNERVHGVGDWLLETEEFKNWYSGRENEESDRAVLFCHGDPGVGKSYISSLVVDYLCDRAIEQDVAVACFYYDFASREEQSPTNMLGSLLKQLVSGLDAIPAEIKRRFRDQKKMIGGRGLQLLDIVNMFPNVSSLQRTFICVDALDECIPKHRLEVLDALGQILQRSPNTRMLMTGRSHVRGTVERELGGRATTISIKPRDGDIVAYLRARLRKDTTPEVMDSELKSDIMNIPEGISETFLLVSLKVEAILRETTIHRRRMRLNSIGDGLGLGDAYEATLGRIRVQDGEKAKLAMTTLMWICHSERPLQVDELCHALAVEIGSTHFNRLNVPAIETLLACCQGLVIVDKEASTVRLIHHSLREYLSTQPNLAARAHSVMAETCLTYLNSDQAKALSDKLQPDLSSMPFLKYCSRYWGTHANRQLSDHVISLAMKLLDQHENHIAAGSLFEQILEPHDSIEVNTPSLFSGLHCVAFFGIIEVMTALLRVNSYDTNRRDSAGLTPFAWAARGGHEEAVRLLLGHQAVDPEKPDNTGMTPLAWAARKGHGLVVKLLLDREDVNADRPSGGGNAPLSHAAFGGHESVVKLLLDRGDVSAGRPDNEDRTPLSWAAVQGHELVVKLLLARGDVSPDRPDNEGHTPLSWAAIDGHESVVKLLLDRGDVNADRPDNEGHTPLSWAAIDGHESVAKLLLDRGDVNPDRPDNKETTPLSWAALQGHESVVKLLLARGGVSPDKPDNRGHTPLSRAASKGHESVVKLLLDRLDVDPDRPDKEGYTPLSWAAIEGHNQVVKLLLDREDVNPDRPDNKDRTPLSWVAIKGHESVVKLFLDREDVDPDRPDNEGNTPLSWAVIKGHESVVKLLLDREDVNPDMPDNCGCTPLSRAAIGGHESMVKLLLDREDVDPDRPDNEGYTPLSWAAIEGHKSVVKLLLDREDVNPDRPDNEGRTPLSWAAFIGHESVVKLLLDRGDVNPNQPDKAGRIPLFYASQEGHEGVVGLLQAWKSPTPIHFEVAELQDSLSSLGL